ncbi:protein FAM32A [Adelges cooleyi]|uniref:protein FAM32A n=1 Tax=Adelges cooleyi TaxID=133065 RepID=UPI00218060CD|nr:protein FAM32A [Adelges cooleyi]XP_050420294.1 protein FAM32A [Adelges cooleyi]
MSEYEVASGGRLRLKCDSGIKKKKKKNNKEKEMEKINKALKAEEVKTKEHYVPPTKAELAFMKQQEKLQKEKIMKVASMTHKQRVEEFNRHLDSLTEHFDIPKVSWTK